MAFVPHLCLILLSILMIIPPSHQQTGFASITIPSNSTNSTRPTSSHSSAPIVQEEHHGLSTGAKAGIGVGVPLGVILMAAAIAAAFYYGKMKASSAMTKETGTPIRTQPGGDDQYAGGGEGEVAAPGCAHINTSEKLPGGEPKYVMSELDGERPH